MEHSIKQELSKLNAEACANSLSELTAKAAKAARMPIAEWKSNANKRQYRQNKDILEQLTLAENDPEKGLHKVMSSSR